MTRTPEDWSALLVVYADMPVPSIRVLGLRGYVNALTAPDLEQILDGQLAALPRALIIDLSELVHLGSEGVQVLACGALRAGLDDIGFCLAGASHPIATVLRSSGLVEALDLHDTVEDALQTYR